MTARHLDRRGFLKSGAACGALALPAGVGRFSGRKTRRVILVAFAGGVRTRETFGSPENVPNLMRMAEEGVAYSRARTSNLGHFGATLSLFTGIPEARGIRENTRGEEPTLFEYVRKDLGLQANDVWISTSGGAQQANYSCSLHPDYGVRFGANTLDGDGIFNAEFRRIVKGYGSPLEATGRERELLERMRGTIGTDTMDRDSGSANAFAQVEQFLLSELTGDTAEFRGVGASDAKALRIARNLMSVFRPTLLGITLQDADVAHRDFNAYVNVIKRNDAMLGELWEAVKADPEIADSTSIFVLPEFGRDRDVNSRRGLDHGDGSGELQFVSAVCWGPDFRRGQQVLTDIRTTDVCTTICELLGANARFARGRRFPKLFA